VGRSAVADMLRAVDIEVALPLIRAFTYFVLLANLAEDIQRDRRRAVHVAAGEPPQDSSLAATYRKLDAAGLAADTVADLLSDALVAPVITAHPTETRRRTVFDAQARITELMRRRQWVSDPRERAEVELGIRRQVLKLWRTALIRLARLRIQDEIAVGLRYYELTLLDVIPAINAEVRAALRSRWPRADLLARPILRPGSWIGGDRDGNPYVTAEVVRHAASQAAGVAFGRYLRDQVELEKTLSQSARLVSVSPEVAALAEAGYADPATHSDEPYRRALHRIRVRLSATAERALGAALPDSATGPDPEPYPGPAAFLGDLDAIDASLRASRDDLLADDRLAALRDAVETFGFHLQGLDMRQN